MRKLLMLSVAAMLVAVSPVYAQSLTFFFKTAYLEPLAQTPTVLNLAAQSSRKVPQADLNAFDDYFLINGNGRLKVNFNRQLQNKGQVDLPGWVGVAPFNNFAISYDLQSGFERVKEHFGMPTARAARVTVYRTFNTGQLVYDYAVPNLPTTGSSCREYLFSPDSGQIELGMTVTCYMTIQVSGRGAAGRRLAR